jgi:hypothetical protein
MRRSPPLPAAVRPFYWTFRILGILLGAAGSLLAVLYARNGYWIPALWVLVMVALFTLLTWLYPTSRLQLPLLAVFGLIVSAFLQSWLVAALNVVLVLVVAWSRRRIGSLPEDFEVVEANEMMKHARGFVDEFQALGFQLARGYSAWSGRFRIVVSLLLGPDGKSYASVTDAVVQVASEFPEGRSLITRNTNVQALPSNRLVNLVYGARPDALVAAHARALDSLAGHGHFPLTLTASELAGIAIDSELEAIEWIKQQGRLRRPANNKTLTESPDQDARIAAW